SGDCDLDQLQLPLFERSEKECNECERRRKEIAVLRAEISRLHELVATTTKKDALSTLAASHGTSEVTVVGSQNTSESFTGAERIGLFRSLFRGREDVYAVRWESKDRSGYAPARKHDWDSHVTDPRTAKKVCGPSCKTLS